MKITIYGAGAAGCAIGAQLHKAGNSVSLIARGKHLRALQNNGLRLITNEGEETLQIPATDDPASIGTQDFVIIATKAYSLPEVAVNLAPMLDENTTIIPACNGVPWWLLLNHDCPLKDYRIKCLDPDGILAKNIPFERIIGGLFYMGATLESPGVASNYGHQVFLTGEPGGENSVRLQNLGVTLTDAGFRNPTRDNIRTEIWRKLCWNTPFNPLSVIHNKNSGEMEADPKIVDTAINMMKEMETLAATLNIPLDLNIDKHLEITRKAGKHKPSMLQDYNNGKPLEIDAIIGSVCEIASELNINIPYISDTYEKLKNAC